MTNTRPQGAWPRRASMGVQPCQRPTSSAQPRWRPDTAERDLLPGRIEHVAPAISSLDDIVRHVMAGADLNRLSSRLRRLKASLAVARI
jgi:hypothetical protein